MKQNAKFWLLGIGITLSISSIILCWATLKAAYFDGYFANGAFQLFNPLRRLAAGQTPGIDFQAFHGLGNILIHFPVFAIFGKNLYASEVARQFVSPFLFILSAFFVALLASRSLAIASLGCVIMLGVAPFIMERLITPANSTLGVRSTFALIACASLLIQKPWIRYVVFALSASATIVSSTEQGIAIVTASLIVGLIVLAVGRSPAILVSVFLAALLACVWLLSVAGEGFLVLLRYNYQQIMQDQIWYFGAPPNPYGVEGMRVMAKESNFWIGALLALMSIGIVIYRWFKTGLTDKVIAALLLVVYGFVTLGSLIGYVVYGSMEPFVRSCLLAAAVVCLPTKLNAIRYAAICSLVLIAVVLLMFRPSRPTATGKELVLEGMKLSPRWAAHAQNISGIVKSNELIWFDYAGLVESQHAIQPASDYIIHALGAQGRREYLDRFQEVSPSWVRTNNVCAWNYGTWLFNENWPFYREVLSNYEPVYSDTLGALFKRSGRAKVDEPKDFAVEQDGCVTITSDQDELLEINAEYAITQTGNDILNKLPRYLIEQRYQSGEMLLGWPTSISVPMTGYPHQWSFPLRLQKGNVVKLCPVVDQKVGNAAFEFAKVSFRRIFVPQETLAYLNCKGKERAYHSR